MAIQDKFNRPNVIYKITKDIDLGGGTLTIPEGCTLDFQGGSFSNGVLKNISSVNSVGFVFKNISFLECAFKQIMPEWFGAKGDGVNDDGLAIQAMFDALDSSLPKTYYNDNVSLPDFRNIRIIFSNQYYTKTPLVLGQGIGLNIDGLRICALTDFTSIDGSDDNSIIILNERQHDTSFSNCIIDGNRVANCIHLVSYTLNTMISNTYIRRFKKYGIWGSENGYELKISNTKITQREYGETQIPDEGIGLYLSSGRNDNNFNNLVISYCSTCSFKVLSSTNYFNNCHFYSATKYSESGPYNFFNSCYFDGDGLKEDGANHIVNCFFSSGEEDENHLFIILNNVGQARQWLHGFDIITNNIFRNNSKNISQYKYPVGTADGTPVKDVLFNFIDNTFLKVDKLIVYSNNIEANKPITINNSAIGSGNESYRVGKLLIQVGEITSRDVTSITFNQIYSSNCIILCTPYNTDSDITKCYAYNVTTKGFSVGTSCRWVAIGYAAG